MSALTDYQVDGGVSGSPDTLQSYSQGVPVERIGRCQKNISLW